MARPMHAPELPIKRLFRVVNGGTPESGDDSLWGGEIAWATPEDLGQLSSPALTETRRTLSSDGLASCGASLVRPGSIVLSTRAPIGHVALAKVPVCTSQGCRSLEPRVGKDVCSQFFFYVLVAFRDELRSRGKGTTFVELSSTDLGALAVPSPSGETQRAIADFLDRKTHAIDELIRKKERLIELLQEKRQALITQAATKGLDPSVPMKDSGSAWIGKIPVHWEVRRVKNLTRIVRGRFSHRPRNDPSLYDGPYPFIQTGDVARARRYISEWSQTLNERGRGVSKEFPPGTLVMAIAANVGDVAILKFGACFPDSVVGFVPAGDADLDYLYLLFHAMRQELLATSTLNTQLNLNVDRIGNVLAPAPPVAEQRQIAQHFTQIADLTDPLVGRIREHIGRLYEYRQALISAAVTGQIDVTRETGA